MLKIKEKRPDAIFEAFSNSAPWWMTYSGCVGGNVNANDDNLKPEYYEAFAHYLVDVCKHYKDVFGIEFKTLEPFNEPNTNYWPANGSQEGCHFSAEAQADFLKVLHPILKESGLNTVISASDETSARSSLVPRSATGMPAVSRSASASSITLASPARRGILVSASRTAGSSSVELTSSSRLTRSDS